MRTTLTLGAVFLAGWLLARGTSSDMVTAAPGPPDFASVVAAIDPSVVHITTTTTSGARPRSRDDNVGAGFVVDASGLIVTNRHVVSGAKRVTVTVKGRGAQVAQVIGTDDATDVALLRIPGGLTPAPVGSSSHLRVGQWVLAAGSPYRLAHTWSVGIVSGLGRRGVGVNPRGLEDYIQTDAAANLGNSGGPLVDGEGRIVGMVTAILSRATGHQGVTLAVPIEAVMASVRRMRGGRSNARRPTIGVRVREVRGGLQVSGFDPGSSAQAAGLALGDLIVRVGDTQVRRAADLQRAVWAGQGRVRITFTRGGRNVVADVPLR